MEMYLLIKPYLQRYGFILFRDDFWCNNTYILATHCGTTTCYENNLVILLCRSHQTKGEKGVRKKTRWEMEVGDWAMNQQLSRFISMPCYECLLSSDKVKKSRKWKSTPTWRAHIAPSCCYPHPLHFILRWSFSSIYLPPPSFTSYWHTQGAEGLPTAS